MLSANVLIDFKEVTFAEFEARSTYSDNELQKETVPISLPAVYSHLLLFELLTWNLEVEETIQVQKTEKRWGYKNDPAGQATQPH